jgi:hypothetical protein
MHRIRKLTLLAVPALFVVVAACSPAAPTPTPDGGDGGGGTEATPTSTPAEGNGGGGGGGGTGDIDAILEQLVPPNSTEVGRFDVEGGVSVSYTSTDNIDDVRSFYDRQLDQMGAQVLSSTEGGGGHAWVFSVGDVTGGSVSAVPSEGATTVVIALGTQ